MKLRNTLVALVLLATLGGVLFYLTKHPQEKKSDSALEKKKLFAFQPAQVKQFTIEAPDQPVVTIRRAAQSKTGQQWEVVAPAGVPGEGSYIQSFIDALPKIEYTALDSQTPASLADYGLDHPKKTLKFDLDSGQSVTLAVGKENPGGYAKYATLSSTPGLMLLDAIDTKDVMEKGLFDLRDKRALPLAVDKAKQLTLHFDIKSASAAEVAKAKQLGLPVKPPKIGMTREPNSNWQLSDPDVRTDFGDTNYFVTTISGAMMSAVEEENPKSLAPYGLDHPEIRLEIKAEDGSTHELLVGKKKVKKEEKAEDKSADKKPGEEKKAEPEKKEEVLGYYAKNSEWPTVFLINQAAYDQLNQDLENYRNRFLFDFDTSNARRLEIQGPSGELRLDKKGEDWLKNGDAQKKADASKVDDFLNSIHALRIQRFTDDHARPADYGLEKPWLKVKVTFSEANKEETVVFGKKDKKFYASRPERPSVYEMAPTEPESLEKKLKDIS